MKIRGVAWLFSWLLLLDGLLFIYFFPDLVPKRLSVDENAVQPRFADPVTRSKEWTDKLAHFEKSFRNNHAKYYQNSDIDIIMNGTMQWMKDQWSKQRMHTYPLTIKSQKRGIYTVYDSPSSDGQMSLIISLTIPLSSLKLNPFSLKPGYLSSLSLIATLTEYMSSTVVNWCSKQLVFVIVFTESTISNTTATRIRKYDGLIDLPMPLVDEHTSYFSKDLSWNEWSDQLFSEGHIPTMVVAALDLELPLYHSDKMKQNLIQRGLEKSDGSLHLWMETVNPQPNLDIIATAANVFRRMRISLDVSPFPWALERVSMLYHSLVQGVTHDWPFSRIDRMTVKSRNGVRHPKQMHRLLMSLELFIRSMSNLIEIFHHATFHYILLSDYQFVTMAEYFGSYGLLLGSLIIHALCALSKLPSQVFNHRFILLNLPVKMSLMLISNAVLSSVIGYYIWVRSVELSQRFLIDHSIFLLCSSMMLIVLLMTLNRSLSDGESSMLSYDYLGLKKEQKQVKQHESCEVRYNCFVLLFVLYFIFAQFWIVLCFNFVIGFVSMLLTVLMSLLFVIRPSFSFIPPFSNLIRVFLMPIIPYLLWMFAKQVISEPVLLELLNVNSTRVGNHPLPSFIMPMVFLPLYLLSLFFSVQPFLFF